MKPIKLRILGISYLKKKEEMSNKIKLDKNLDTFFKENFLI